jgi:hypothetical protein
LRDDLGSLEEGYRRAQEMLRPVAYPVRYPALPKLLALKQCTAHLGQTCSRPSIRVFRTRLSRRSVRRPRAAQRGVG